MARGRLVDHRLENVQVIFRQQPKSNGGRHFGSRLVFDRNGLLYITLGDRGEQERAQKTDDLAGKIVRLHDDGRIPKDNPFVKQPGVRPEIFRSATATCRARRCTPPPGNCGPTSNTRRAATRSTSSAPAATTAGRSSPTASNT